MCSPNQCVLNNLRCSQEVSPAGSDWFGHVVEFRAEEAARPYAAVHPRRCSCSSGVENRRATNTFIFQSLKYSTTCGRKEIVYKLKSEPEVRLCAHKSEAKSSLSRPSFLTYGIHSDLWFTPVCRAGKAITALSLDAPSGGTTWSSPRWGTLFLCIIPCQNLLHLQPVFHGPDFYRSRLEGPCCSLVEG